MADSKFLKWQDKNGDMIPDVCPDVVKPAVNPCLNCSPNPTAIVPRWKKGKRRHAFLNEQTCVYQVAWLTSETSTGAISENTPAQNDKVLGETFEKYSHDAIKEALIHFNKDSKTNSIEKVKEVLEYTNYDLDPRPGSYLKLLYSFPFDVLFNLPDAEEEEEEEEPQIGERIVSYSAHDLLINNIRVRKGLGLYARYLAVYQTMESGNLLYLEDNRVFNLREYGEGFWPAFTTDGMLARVLIDLDAWLVERGFNLPNTGAWFQGGDAVKGIEFTFETETITDLNGVAREYPFKLKKMIVTSDRCASKTYGKGAVASLNSSESWRDQTAIGYFAQMREMSADMSARVEIPWLEVLKNYTYPAIHATINAGHADLVQNKGETSAGMWTCIGDNLAQEGKQLGQDVLNEFFGIADAIAYEWHKKNCQGSVEEVMAGRGAAGNNPGPPKNPPVSSPPETLVGLARTQAFKEVDSSDQIYAKMCAQLLYAGADIKMGSSPWMALNEFSSKGLNRLAICGFADLLLEGIQCLFGGLSLQEALSRMIRSALKAMAIRDFGRLFVGLPPEKQAELDEKVQEKLRQKSIFPPDFGTETYTSQAQESGVTFGEASLQEEKDAHRGTFFGKYAAVRPWENAAFVEESDQAARSDGQGNFVSTYDTKARVPQTRRTLAQKLEVATVAGEEWNSGTLMNEYILALLEVYQDNYLELLDQLNRFPGAQIIAFIFASISCPHPPLFNPGIDDFIKSLGLPFCRNTNPIVYPYLDNPFLYLPKLKDLLSNLWKVVAAAFMEAVRESIKLILKRVCEILGDAICHALETVGDLAAALPDMAMGRTTFSEVIKESICGPNADDELVNNTVAQLMNDLGPGGAALANRGRALTFAEDISSAATKSEILGAMLGEGGTDDYLAAIDAIIEYEYPEFRDALPGVGAIGSFFKNVGNLAPLEARAQMRDAYRGLSPAEAVEPINPTLCATPEKLESFKELRCQLLEGRATPEQCDKMFDDWRATTVDQLDDLADALQQGNAARDPFKDKPLFSDPGCSNGLLPREPAVNEGVAGQMLAGALEKLQIEYTVDMLGDGPRQNNYGFMNMVLSDTLGNPFTVHQTKTNANAEFVDFYVNPNPWGFMSILDPFGLDVFSSVSQLYLQEGAYPQYVGEYLKYQFENAGPDPGPSTGEINTDVSQDLATSLEFKSGNDYTRDITTFVSVDQLGDEGIAQRPDMGYNVQMNIIYRDEHKHSPSQAVAVGEEAWAENFTPWLKIIKKARKSPPDITLKFRDNAKGYRSGPNQIGGEEWGYGFDINTYIADIYKNSDGDFVNREDDNTRIYITKTVNEKAKTAKSGVSLVPTVGNMGSPESSDVLGAILLPFVAPTSLIPGMLGPEDPSVIKYRDMSFLAIDDGLDMFFNLESMQLDEEAMAQAQKDYNLEDYPNFAEGFVRHIPEAPQVNLLYDFFDGQVSKASLKNAYDSFMSVQFGTIAGAIGANETAWLYGASFEDLSFADFEYIVPPDIELAADSPSAEPVLISEALVPDFDSDGNRLAVPRKIRDDDGILGTSRMQWRADTTLEAGNTPLRPNRVFYLDPLKYGGNYMNPPVYVAPMTGSGWMGVVDVLFPEMSPCKPSNNNLIDFGDIANKMSKLYTTLPDDPRLLEDPNCTEEVPYNRILERPAAAGIQGLIMAAIRTFVSVHYIKSLATFTTFAPKFPDNYSNVYAHYIVEQMKKAFIDSSTQWFSPIQENEFWYAFLEQAVQMYGYLVDAEAEGGNPWDMKNVKAEEIPLDVLAALEHINDYQQAYVYPSEDDLQIAQYYELAGDWDSLETYRQDQNLAAVRATEDSAKTILKELVIHELRYMSEKFINNLKPLNMEPAIRDLDYYYMSTFCAGSTLDLQKEFVETPVGLPTPENPDPSATGALWPGPYYSNGNEFSLPDGTTYVGYYHGYYNEEEARLMYMVGEEHSAEEHQELRPFANKLEVKIGDVPPWLTGPAPTPEQPFIIEKYISINGGRYTPDNAVAIIKAKKSGNISDHFPGTLKFQRAKSIPLVNEGEDGATLILTNKTDPATGAFSNAYGPAGAPQEGILPVVGLKGELGVRYGLSFKMDVGGAVPEEIVNIEIDALDIPVSAMPPLDKNSKLLLCLINKLKENPRFKLITQYVFSMKRALGIVAIYNDLGLLPSIGEYTVKTGALHGVQAWSFGPTYVGNTKPGGWIQIRLDEDTGIVTDASIYYERGWVSANERNKWGQSPFFMKYDEWDQQLLRNSVRCIRDMFRTYYYARDATPLNYEGGTIVAEFLEQFKERFRINPAKGLLPWWKQNRVRSNPFNSNGQLCTKKD